MLVVVLSGLHAARAQDGSGEPGWSFAAPGKTIRYKVKLDHGEKSGPALEQIKAQFTLLARPLEAKENGEAKWEIRVESMKMVVTNPCLRQDYDSTRDEGPPEGDRILPFHAFLLKPVQATVTREGIVREVSGSLTRIAPADALDIVGQAYQGAAEGLMGELVVRLFSIPRRMGKDELGLPAFGASRPFPNVSAVKLNLGERLDLKRTRTATVKSIEGSAFVWMSDIRSCACGMESGTHVLRLSDAIVGKGKGEATLALDRGLLLSREEEKKYMLPLHTGQTIVTRSLEIAFVEFVEEEEPKDE
jgi:hypothetical protein